VKATVSKVKFYCCNRLEIAHRCKKKAVQFYGDKVILGKKSKYIAEIQLFLFWLDLLPAFIYECYIRNMFQRESETGCFLAEMHHTFF